MMDMRQITSTFRVIAVSQLRLPSEVTKYMQRQANVANRMHARITNIIMGPESPIGAHANYEQTVTMIAEGDYDDPVFREAFNRGGSVFATPVSSGLFSAAVNRKLT